jgi:hypothetical protein
MTTATARLPAILARCLTLALPLLLLGPTSWLHASPADPKPPKPGATALASKTAQPPLPGIFSATVVTEVPDRGHFYDGKPLRATCGGEHGSTGHFVVYYPGPGKRGLLLIQGEHIYDGSKNVTYATQLHWDPYFYNPPKTGVTPLHPDSTNPPGDPFAHYAVANLPANDADPEAFHNRDGNPGGDVTTTFDSPTHFWMAGIWAWGTEVCYQTWELSRIGCAGDHAVAEKVQPGSDGSPECQSYCVQWPDCGSSGKPAVTGATLTCHCSDRPPNP